MASFLTIISSSPTLFFKTRHLSPPSITSITRLNLKDVWGRQLVLLRVNCLSEDEPISKDVVEETEPTDSFMSSSTSISSYNWCAGLGGLGFLETAYLTYLKLTDSDAFCPIGGGGSCANILNSDYALLFGTSFRLMPL